MVSRKNLRTVKGYDKKYKFSNVSCVPVMIGKLPNLNIDYVKSADLMTKIFCSIDKIWNKTFLKIFF